MNRESYFRKFSDLSAESLQMLLNLLRTKHFKKGARLVQVGQIQKELYLVKSGVQMSYFESEERSHVIAFTYPPNLCAVPESFSFQKPSNCELVCITDSEMDCLSYDDLQGLFERSHEIERLFRIMTEAILAGLINRHIELHSMTIEARFKAFCQRSPHLLQLVPHKYIASYLGIDPTNFSKLFNTVKI